MMKTKIEYKGKVQKYILSILDFFFPFHWLALLESKLTIEMKNKLEQIYLIQRTPKQTQSDSGGEFKRDVKQRCTKNQIKMIGSQLYNPKAQGKLE